MTATEQDKVALKVSVDMVDMSPRYYHTSVASETESQIRAKLESFKIWANKLIEEKLK